MTFVCPAVELKYVSACVCAGAGEWLCVRVADCAATGSAVGKRNDDSRCHVQMFIVVNCTD